MDTSRVKNYIIILLLLVNAFLLSIVILDGVESKRARDSAFESIYEILAINGISSGGELNIPDTDVQAFSLSRSLTKEREIAEAVIGKTSRHDSGGNIYAYTSELGEAVFRSGGDFIIELSPTAKTGFMNYEDTAEKFLDAMDIVTVNLTSTETEEGDTLVQTFCRWNKLPVFNCQISFFFRADELLRIEGRRMFDGARTEDITALEFPNILLSFLNTRRDSGSACSELKSVEIGYFQQVSAAGGSLLFPLWAFYTDVGIYYINGATGETTIVYE